MLVSDLACPVDFVLFFFLIELVKSTIFIHTKIKIFFVKTLYLALFRRPLIKKVASFQGEICYSFCFVIIEVNE